MEDKLGALADGLFVELVGEDLVEVVGVELLVVLPVPQPYLRLDALHVLVLLGRGSLLGATTLELQYIVIHQFPSNYIIHRVGSQGSDGYGSDK